jgi:NADH:ubiquinone oxidoreductase subunit
MKEAGKYVEDQKMIIFEKYLTHCAIMIQKHWKGWIARNITYPKQRMMVKRREAEKRRDL